MKDSRRIYGLVGFPLEHSFSRRYFTEKFEREGIDAEYLNFEIEDIREFPGIIERIPELAGFNVTIPHKEHVIPLLHELSPEARSIGAVNCVKIERVGGIAYLTGYNTDAYGFKKSLCEFIPSSTTKALVLGNGGAAKAVRHVLKELHVEFVTVSRTPQNEQEIGYASVSDLLSDYKLIINTTPLGTWPHTETCPDIPYFLLSPEHYLFDLVYNPEVTEFMRRGKEEGAYVRNGLQMLVGQAEKAWKIWMMG